jgi:hypothetical protein
MSTYIRVSQAAEELSVSRQSIHNYIASGTLEILDVSTARKPKRHHVRITRKSIDQFLARRAGTGWTPAHGKKRA